MWTRVVLVDAVASDAIKEGFGVSMIPVAIGELDPELVRMPAIPPQEGAEIWLLTHLDVRSNARMRVFRDFMQEFFQRRRTLLDLSEAELVAQSQ